MGTHFQLFSDGVHPGTNRYEIGNINLDIEQANQIDLKYQWANEHFGIVLNPFFKTYLILFLLLLLIHFKIIIEYIIIFNISQLI